MGRSNCHQILLTVLALLLWSAHAQLDNEMAQIPEVECQSQRIKISMNTKKDFSGKIYLKGNFHRDECVTDFSKVKPDNASSFQVAIDYNLCNTERIRTLSPNGVTYANTMVVQFHKTFITAGDKAYHIRCFYSELEKTVTSNFDVSMIPTGSLQYDMEMPKCSYTVRRGTVNGPLVRSAQVGDEVYHRWECTGNTHAYGMLVHSCIVENTGGEKEDILTSQGCSLDRDLLPSVEYNDQLSMGYAKSRVFKYPDNSFVHFKCQIKICTKMDNACDLITPPNCNTRPRRARSLESGYLLPVNGTVASRNEMRRKKIQEHLAEASLDVVTGDILVLDEGSSNEGYKSYNTMSDPSVIEVDGSRQVGRRNTTAIGGDALNLTKTPAQLCASRFIIVCILAGFFLFFASALIFIVYLMIRNRAKHMTSEDILNSAAKYPAPSSENGLR